MFPFHKFLVIASWQTVRAWDDIISCLISLMSAPHREWLKKKRPPAGHHIQSIPVITERRAQAPTPLCASSKTGRELNDASHNGPRRMATGPHCK